MIVSGADHARERVQFRGRTSFEAPAPAAILREDILLAHKGLVHEAQFERGLAVFGLFLRDVDAPVPGGVPAARGMRAAAGGRHVRDHVAVGREHLDEDHFLEAAVVKRQLRVVSPL